MTKRPFRYQGALAIPLRLPVGASLEPENRIESYGAWFARITALFEHFEIDLTDPSRDEKLARLLAQRHEPDFKLEWLFERYGVDPEEYFELALMLAHEHVPAFRMTHPSLPKGRPRKFRTAEMITIVVEIIKLTDKGLSEREACRVLACSERWQDYTADEIRECWKEAKTAPRNLIENRLTGSQYYFLRFFAKRVGEN